MSAPLLSMAASDAAARAQVLRRLELAIAHRLEGRESGDHASYAYGPGSERSGARPYAPGDDARLVAVSERMVAITQGRSYPIDEIRPGRLARFLERYVMRPGYGIGLGSAQTMQLAIDEVGSPRILLAAAASAVTKPFGVHGVFYRLAGPQVRAIDGPTSYTIPPYNQAATLGPRRPDEAARKIAAALGAPVAIIDANDAGCAVLGASPGVDRRFVQRLFADNPLGQAREQTPVCLVREVPWPTGQELPAEPRRRLTPP